MSALRIGIPILSTHIALEGQWKTSSLHSSGQRFCLVILETGIQRPTDKPRSQISPGLKQHISQNCGRHQQFSTICLFIVYTHSRTHKYIHTQDGILKNLEQHNSHVPSFLWLCGEVCACLCTGLTSHLPGVVQKYLIYGTSATSSGQHRTFARIFAGLTGAISATHLQFEQLQILAVSPIPKQS